MSRPRKKKPRPTGNRPVNTDTKFFRSDSGRDIPVNLKLFSDVFCGPGATFPIIKDDEVVIGADEAVSFFDELTEERWDVLRAMPEFVHLYMTIWGDKAHNQMRNLTELRKGLAQSGHQAHKEFVKSTIGLIGMGFLCVCAARRFRFNLTDIICVEFHKGRLVQAVDKIQAIFSVFHGAGA